MSSQAPHQGGPSELGRERGGGLLDLPLGKGSSSGSTSEPSPRPPGGSGRRGPSRGKSRLGWWLALALFLIPLALALGYLSRPSPPVGTLSLALADFGELSLESEPGLIDLQLVNRGESPLEVTSIDLVEDSSPAFRVAEETCTGRVVAREQSCALALAFEPVDRGRHRGSLQVVTNAANSPLRLPLEGLVRGAQLTQELEELQFGIHLPGVSSEAQTFWVGNAGNAELRLGQLAFVGEASADFFPAEDSCSARTLAPSARCRLSLYFVPSEGGDRKAELVIESDAPQGALRVRLGGRGQAQVPELSASVEQLVFPPTPVGQRSEPLVAELNNSGSGELRVENVAFSTTGHPFELLEESCTRAPLAPTEACRVSVAILPVMEDEAKATLEVVHSASDRPWTLALEGAGALPRARISHAKLGFGEVALGKSGGAEKLRLENVGGAPLQVGEVGFFGGDEEVFSVREDGCSARLVAPGDSCALTLLFSPRRNGPHRTEFLLSHAAQGGRERVLLSGIGVSPRLEAVPARLGFGDTTVGRPQTLDLNLSNTGRAPVRIERLRLAGANRSDLNIQEDGCSRRRLIPGAACKIRLTFNPSAPGPRRAELEISHDASPQLLRVPLSGVGRL